MLDHTKLAASRVEALCGLLTTVSGVEDETERARLLATGLPGLIPCVLSGVILLHEDGSGDTLLLDTPDGLLPTRDSEPLLTAWHPMLRTSFGPQLFNETEDEFPDLFRKHQVTDFALYPLITLRNRFGALLVGKQEPFAREEIFFLLALAGLYATSVENLRLNGKLTRYSADLENEVRTRTAKLERSEKRRRFLLDLSHDLMSGLRDDALLEPVSACLRTALSFDCAQLTLVDEARTIISSYTLEGRSATWKDTREPLYAPSVLQAAQPVVHIVAPRKDRLRSYIGVPVMGKAGPLGVLEIASRRRDRYAPDDVQFLQEMAAHIGPALEHTRAYDQIALLRTRVEQENIYLKQELKSHHKACDIIGDSGPVRTMLNAIEVVAPTTATVLVTGETGTGKELVASAIHNLSTRKDKSLVRVNCAALPSNLIESELFGHEKGAFTGAGGRSLGRFELANGGTLFLDEIAEIPLDLQAKLLRVLQEGEFERLGSATTQKVDVRIVTATNRSLEQAVAENTFRADLFYRLNVFPIKVPPLRERREDIPLLCKFFLRRYSKRLGKTVDHIDQDTMQRLCEYDWPGNVRELENMVERGMILSAGRRLELGDWLPPANRGESTAAEAAQLSSSTERLILREADRKRQDREAIIAALEKAGGKVAGAGGAAEILGVKSTTLESRIKTLGIVKPRRR